MEKFEIACEALGIYLHHKAFVFPRESSPVLRIMAIGSWENKVSSQENVYIKKEDDSYTKGFEKLLSDYYLQFPLH
jgi:tRNA1(Val) A37 N6-methylase TrmN6